MIDEPSKEADEEHDIVRAQRIAELDAAVKRCMDEHAHERAVTMAKAEMLDELVDWLSNVHTSDLLAVLNRARKLQRGEL